MNEREQARESRAKLTLQIGRHVLETLVARQAAITQQTGARVSLAAVAESVLLRGLKSEQK